MTTLLAVKDACALWSQVWASGLPVNIPAMMGSVPVFGWYAWPNTLLEHISLFL